MRRYFYLLIFLFSFSVSSQDVNDEIVGKWKVIGMPQAIICGTWNTDYRSLINSEFEFSKYGEFFYFNSNISEHFKKILDSKWFINESNLIEVQTLNNEPMFEVGFKKGNEGFYYIFIGVLRFRVLRIED